MTTMKKRIGSLLIAFMMVLTMMPAMAFAAGETDSESVSEVNKFKYEYNSSGTMLEITGYYGTPEVLIVPAEINGIKVESIGDSAFASQKNLKKVIIEEGVSKVGEFAFRYCTSLEEVQFPNTMKYISGYSFEDTKIKNIEIPEGVETIYGSTFRGCSSLESVILPQTVTRINMDAFSGCIKLKDIELPENLEYIGSMAFDDCESITELNIPSSVKEIGTGGYSVVDYEGYFKGCKSLENINVEPQNTNYYSYDGVLYNSSKNKLLCYPKARTDFKIIDNIVEIDAFACDSCSIENLVIPDGLLEIGDAAFGNCGNMRSVIFPENEIPIIGDSLFSNCRSLSSISLPKYLTVIEWHMFYGCESLAKIEIPSGVTKIGSYAFAECQGMEIVIPESVTSIEQSAFGYDENIILIGYPDSYAHEFAKSWLMKFKCITDHTPGPAATCSSAQKCTVCGEELVSATGQHDIVKHELKLPTCTESGQMPYEECVREGCGYTTYVANSWIPATGHTPGPRATCTTAQICTECNTVLASATGHTPGPRATCITAQVCRTCDTLLTPATGHSEITDKAKPATTKVAGVTAGSHCATCKEVFVAQKAIPRIKTVTLKTAKYTYNGKAKKPVFTVKDTKGKTLKQGTDYTIKYTNNKGKVVKTANVGTYKAVVTFKGNYSGSASKQFVVNPKATAINKLTKPAKKQIKVTWKKQTAQVTGYQLRYSTKSSMSGAKTVLVKSSKTTTKTIKSLKAKKKYYVQIRTYKTVNGTKYYSDWSKKKNITTK